MFDDALIKFEAKISSELAAGKTTEVIGLVQAGAGALTKLYPTAVSEWLAIQGVTAKLQSMRELVTFLDGEMKAYRVNDLNGRIEVQTGDGAETSFPLVPLDKIIKEELGIDSQQSGYFLILGLLMQPKYFELVQLAQATKRIAGIG